MNVQWNLLHLQKCFVFTLQKSLLSAYIAIGEGEKLNSVFLGKRHSTQRNTEALKAVRRLC